MSRANTRDLVGSTAVVSGVRPKTLLCDKLYRILLDERKATPRFVSLWLQTRAARSHLELEATGASDSMQNIGQDTVRRVTIPLPTREQQEAFVARCDQERTQIRKLVGAIQQQIRLLQERRQALITAAVTGDLDIAERA
jgi:type I restriction enzyme S subunit